MWRVREIITGGIVVLVASLPAFPSESGLDTKAAQLFDVTWTSISYNKSATVTVANPANSSGMFQRSSGSQSNESLSLSALIEFLDPNRVLGTSREGVITRLVDGAGHDVNVPPASMSMPMSSRAAYEPLRRMRRPAQPRKVSKWEAFARSVLKLPVPRTTSPPQMVNQVQPHSMSLRLPVELLNPPAGEIRRVKGYFYAMMPDSTKSIDVPFEPNSTWVQLTPGLEIQVSDATCTGASYRYSLQTSRQRASMPAAGAGFGGFGNSMSDTLAAPELIGTDGKPVSYMSSSAGSSGAGGMVTMTGSGGGLSGPIKSFRFVIPINPSEHKIPFELEHIPLPKP